MFSNKVYDILKFIAQIILPRCRNSLYITCRYMESTLWSGSWGYYYGNRHVLRCLTWNIIYPIFKTRKVGGIDMEDEYMQTPEMEDEFTNGGGEDD